MKNTTPSTPQPSTVAILAAFGAIYIIWGSTYLGIRFAIETIPPFLMAGIRFLFAGAILFGWATWRGAGWPSQAHWRSAFVIGSLLLVGGNGLLTWAEQFVPSGIAALIVATVPMWMVMLEALRKGGQRPTWTVILGLVLGLVGLAVLIGPGNLGGEPVHLFGALVVCLASFSWALGSIFSKTATQAPSTLQNVGMQMLQGGALLVVGGLVLGERLDPSMVSARSFWSLVYLSLIGGVIGYTAYVWLLKVASPAKVSTYAYVNPVVAVILGWALAGEALNSRVFLATAAVVGAVILISWQRRPKTPSTETAKTNLPCPEAEPA